MHQRTSRLTHNKENVLCKPVTRASPPLTRSRAFGRDITNEVSSLMEVDSSEDRDPLTLPYYAREIFDFLYASELRFSPVYGYMKRQADVTEKMRAILVDWLVEVHLKFKLLPETLFLTVNIIDRVLERQPILRQKLQLVGVVSMLIASKYEEIYAPEVRDLVHITDKAFNREEILEMEGQVLQIVDYNLTTPSSYRFLEHFGKIASATAHTEMLAQYLLELGLVEYKMLKYRASLVAAAALYLASKLDQREKPWSADLTEQTHYSELELKTCAKDLCVLVQGAEKSSLQAARKKFALPKYLEVSTVSVFQAITPSFKS